MKVPGTVDLGTDSLANMIRCHLVKQGVLRSQSVSVRQYRHKPHLETHI